MMITDAIVGAMDTMIDLCINPEQKQGMLSLREMLCDLDEEQWYKMTPEQEREWLSSFINDLPDASNSTKQEPLTFAEAKEDILTYLSGQDEAYFLSRGKTKTAVLQDRELIDNLAAEHRKCVNNFGNDREWSWKDACDAEPGICTLEKEPKPSLLKQIRTAAAAANESKAGKVEERKESAHLI